MQAIYGIISENCRFEESTELLRKATTLCPAKGTEPSGSHPKKGGSAR
jgi:hypothetical protein